MARMGVLLIAMGGTPAAAADPTMSAMIRNIRLGTNVAIARKLLPDRPAAAQFMWEQVRTAVTNQN